MITGSDGSVPGGWERGRRQSFQPLQSNPLERAGWRVEMSDLRRDPGKALWNRIALEDGGAFCSGDPEVPAMFMWNEHRTFEPSPVRDTSLVLAAFGVGLSLTSTQGWPYLRKCPHNCG